MSQRHVNQKATFILRCHHLDKGRCSWKPRRSTLSVSRPPPTSIFLSFPNQFKEFQTDDVTNLTTATGVTLPTYTLREIAFSRRRTWIKRLKCFIWIRSWMDWSRFQSGRAEAVTSSWQGRAKWKPALPGYSFTQSPISALVAATVVTRSKEVQTKDNKLIPFYGMALPVLTKSQNEARLERSSCYN